MKDDLSPLPQKAILGIFLFGHIVNLLACALIFLLCTVVLQISAGGAVASSLAVGLIGGACVSILGTLKIKKRTAAMHHEVAVLHEKINESTTALTNFSQTSQALIEDLPIGLLVFNKKTELIRSSRYTYYLLGFGETPPTTEQVLEMLKNAKSNGQGINFVDWLHESRAKKIQDMKRWPLVIFEGKESRTICDLLVHYNKNDSNNYELALILIDRTNEYNRQEKQMEFISLAAHELRGPITIMRGLVDILQQELGATLSSEHKELITRISVSARQLAGYVDNILSVSRVDNESFEVHVAEAKWPELVTQAMRDLSIRASAHHRKLEVDMPQTLPDVAVDPTAIQHVLNNLVDNAIKYSRENGVISVTAKVKDGVIETTVQDAGIGIPASVVDNLFTRFYRSHRSKQIVSGTGLGLYLCKAIVEAHGGNIWVRSTEGAGTTFGFTLPTYESVAQQLEGNSQENGIIRSSHGWIKNHALYRR